MCFLHLSCHPDSCTLSPFYRQFSRWAWVSRYQNVSNSPFWILLELWVMEVAVTTGACMTCKAPVKMSPSTNQHPAFFTGQMPFLSPNQQCKSTLWRIWFLPSRRASRSVTECTAVISLSPHPSMIYRVSVANCSSTSVSCVVLWSAVITGVQ